MRGACRAVWVAPARLVRLQQVMRVAPSDEGLCELRCAAVRCSAQSGAAELCDVRHSGTVGGEHSPPDSQELCAGVW